MSTPPWIISQRRARRQCERCGQPASANVTWADKGTDEFLCTTCWDKAAQDKAAAEDTALALSIAQVLGHAVNQTIDTQTRAALGAALDALTAALPHLARAMTDEFFVAGTPVRAPGGTVTATAGLPLAHQRLHAYLTSSR